MKSKRKEKRRIKNALRKTILAQHNNGLIEIPNIVILKYPKIVASVLRRVRKSKKIN